LASELRHWADRLAGPPPQRAVPAHPFDRFRAGGTIDATVQYAGAVCGTIPDGARVEIGPESIFLGRLYFHLPGTFRMGARSYVGPGTEIHVTRSVSIGNDVMVAWGCTLLDTDNHALPPAQRARDVLIAGGFRGLTLADKDWSSVRCEPVVIEDTAWLGAHCIVLPGVRIGAGTVVGAGSVVPRSVPSDVVVAGNPARVVRPVNLPASAAGGRALAHMSEVL